MKFKEIKPGMVIHCPTKEDARVLLEHLERIGYCAENVVKECAFAECGNQTCFCTNSPSVFFGGRSYVSYGDIEFYTKDDDFKGITITEFSDLIEHDSDAVPKIEWKFDLKKGYLEGKPVSDSPINSPTDSPMSAVEVLEWLLEHHQTSVLFDVFGECDMGNVIKHNFPEEVIRKITAYEAAKKAPKPVEVERGYRCYVFMGEHTAYTSETEEYELWGVTEDEAKDDVKAKAIEKTKETGKPATAEHYFICRVKEGES